MLKWKLKNTLAGVLAAALLLQTLPAPVLAEVLPADMGVSQTEQVTGSAEPGTAPAGSTQQAQQTNSESTASTGSTQPEQTNSESTGSETTNGESAENAAKDTESSADEQPGKLQESGESEQESSDEESQNEEKVYAGGSEENSDDTPVNEVSISSTRDFIEWSNKEASTYQNAVITITQGNGDAFDLTQTVDNKTFQGFGSKEYPFKGKIEITSGGSSDIVIPLNRSFFNYLDQSATIGEGLYLQAKGEVAGALLAENFVNSSKTDETQPTEESSQRKIKLTIQAVGETDATPSFGGIIGTMGANTALSLSVTDKTESNAVLSISGTGNLGFFCNTMEAGAQLTVADYTRNGENKNTISYDITSGRSGEDVADGHAGGLVGEMKDGSSLRIVPSLTLTGNVTANASSGAAGGLVGAADNAQIAFGAAAQEQTTSDETADAVAITRTGTVQGKMASGGYIGKAAYKNADTTLDFANFKIDDTKGIALAGGNHSGGLFGVLNYDCSNGTLAIQNVKLSKVTYTGENKDINWQFGGVIGQYSASDLASALVINNPEITIFGSGKVTAFGGVIGSIAGSGAADSLKDTDGGLKPAYVEIDSASVTLNLVDGADVADFGGLVAEMNDPDGAGQGHILSVSGTVSISGSDSGKAAGGVGGILGNGTNGAVRLSGTTNLSKFTIGTTGTRVGQIAGKIGDAEKSKIGTVVYALGSGNDSESSGNSEDTYNWKFIRPEANTVSDVGSYGEVIRLNAKDLQENKTADANDTNTLFVFDKTTHEFSVNYTPGENATVSSKRDLAALAVLMQQGKNDDLLGKNITVNSNIDLSGTGIYALLRDDGSQTYTGTFNGSNCTIKVAAGEAYGFLSDGKTPTDGNNATVGIGQIYNHSTIGFIPVLGENANVENLTLDGSIYFQNVSGGVDVDCGAAAGRAQNAELNNVTVKTKIVYSDGKTDDDLKPMPMRIGGFVGRTESETLKFTGCSMQGSIFSSSGCYTFAIGGYVAMAGEDKTQATVTFSNCKVSGSSITHSKFEDGSSAPDARFGGVIGSLFGSVDINGFTIDDLTMESDATGTAGGLLGYEWKKVSSSDYISIQGLTVKKSSLTVENAKFGGLVYQTDAYWKIGNGNAISDNNQVPGILFESGDNKANEFTGKTDKDAPSALLVCDTTRSDDTSDKAYIEICKDGLQIKDNAVAVTLKGGDYFDDIAGKTKYTDGTSAVVSIGLTAQSAANVTLVDKNEKTSWENHCTVNSKKGYTNKNTRYYYNLDYYRNQVENDTTADIDTPGKLLLWSVNKYSQSNLSSYFKAVTGKITGSIDLTGVSYYPVAACCDINDATITFDYSAMNKNAGIKYSNENQQHSQMQTGLFTNIVTRGETPITLNVTNLKLKGTFGVHKTIDEKGDTISRAGVLICGTTGGTKETNRVTININNLTLDGIQAENGTSHPLLIYSIGSYTSVSMDGVTYTRERYEQKPIASALMGQVGSEKSTNITLDFANMDLAQKGETSEKNIFQTAVFATAFQYSDNASDGNYNFEKNTEKITFGKEISNGVPNVKPDHNRNSYDAQKGTGQVWYLDTFGETGKGSYVGAAGAADSPQNFSAYLPYIGESEDSTTKHYELDVNQRSVYLVDGCGTYGHPWVIQDVKRGDKTLFKGEDQMIAVMKLLDGAGVGTAVRINTTVLTKKLEGQTDPINSLDLHSAEGSENDKVYIKQSADKWVEADLDPSGTRYKAKTNGEEKTNNAIKAYLRNGYFVIKKDLTLNVAQFTGLGSYAANDPGGAFSGVIVGDSLDRKITLTGTTSSVKETYTQDGRLTESEILNVGGLIRYSQGSVVKDLTIVYAEDLKVRIPYFGASIVQTHSKSNYKYRAFFGGVIGWVVGGDNIIDNVKIVNQGVTIVGDKDKNNKNTDTANLAAIGGYVGLVGGYDTRLGGGVVFRNMGGNTSTSKEGSNDSTKGTYAGLTKVTYDSKNDSQKVQTNTEATGENGTTVTNDKYYWNPYVGRVLDGYVCAEADNCSQMGNNTNKNYKIPKLNENEKLNITSREEQITSGQYKSTDISKFTWKVNLYPNSIINPKSAQAVWLLSAIVNSGYGAKTPNYSNQDVQNKASYFGRTRTGDYATVGTTDLSESDKIDEADYWGGDNGQLNTTNNEFPHYQHSISYLSTYITLLDNDGKEIDDAKKAAQAMFSLAVDVGQRNITFDDITYDLTSYGNGFRGIGHEYYMVNKYSVAKARAMRLGTVQGKTNTDIQYSRTVYDYSSNDCHIEQAGFFPEFLGQDEKETTFKNLTFSNVTLQRINNSADSNVSFGIVAGKNGCYIPKTLNFESVAVKSSTIMQAGQAGGIIGYIDSKKDTSTTAAKPRATELKFEGCSIETVTANRNTDKNFECNYFGGFVGRVDKVDAKLSTSVTFSECKAKNIFMYRVKKGGTFAGYAAGDCTVTDSTVNAATLHTKETKDTALGGLIGQADSQLTVSNTTLQSIHIDTLPEAYRDDPERYAGGLAGKTAAATIENTTVNSCKAVAIHAGGAIGAASGAVMLKNYQLKESILASNDDAGTVGGLVGRLTDSLQAFNALSTKNTVGHLIRANGAINSTGIANDKNNSEIEDLKRSINKTTKLYYNAIDFDKLNKKNIGLKNSTNKYKSYNTLAASTDEQNKLFSVDTTITCGIWVGHAQGSNVQIVAASRQGDYSAVRNVGSNAGTGSYVIYADYTGQASSAGEVSIKPDETITVDGTKLTGDGAATVNGAYVRNSIIKDTVESKSLMKGYFGASEKRPLDDTVKEFYTDMSTPANSGQYASQLTSYKTVDKTESNSYTTNVSTTDFPILLLYSTDALNKIVKDYITTLTNDSKAKYASIKPTTYQYKDNSWHKLSDDPKDQTLTWDGTSKTLKITRGKHDNANKDAGGSLIPQITVLDVVYQSPVGDNKDAYHLYIPVLVKKLMDVSTSLKVLNGAVGYDVAIPKDAQAPLNSFGENYTMRISYTYKWTVAEWNAMLENGESLLWNFDKTVTLGDYENKSKKLEKKDIHLTLVSMNTHGSQPGFYQGTMSELESKQTSDNKKALQSSKLNLDAMAELGYAPVLCDLLPLKAEQSTTGNYKTIEGIDSLSEAKTSGAVVRIWDETNKKFVYYAPKAEGDAKDTQYYTITLNTSQQADATLENITEQYYLVMNCTKGSGMYNMTVGLNDSYTVQTIPTKVEKNANKVYVLGDFYKIREEALTSNGNTVMAAGSNDSIEVILSSKVEATVIGNDLNDFGKYVNDRDLYYQYFLQLMDQDGKPVEMDGTVSLTSLTMQKTGTDDSETTNLTPATGDLSAAATNSYTVQRTENGYYITIKAKGSSYTDAAIEAKVAFSYTSEQLNSQFPLRGNAEKDNTGVHFAAKAVLAYQYESLGSSTITAQANESKVYYRETDTRATLSYDSYNIVSTDGNTSQLGINGREDNGTTREITSRAIFDATQLSGLNLTDSNSDKYPAYLECELSLAKKTEKPETTAANEQAGTESKYQEKSYSTVSIKNYFAEYTENDQSAGYFKIDADGVKGDTTSNGLGFITEDGVQKFKFRIALNDDQIKNIQENPIVVNIRYQVKTGEELEKLGGSGLYANYKLTLSAQLQNRNYQNLQYSASDYLVYTNAQVYQGIIGVTDVDSNSKTAEDSESKPAQGE